MKRLFIYVTKTIPLLIFAFLLSACGSESSTAPALVETTFTPSLNGFNFANDGSLDSSLIEDADIAMMYGVANSCYRQSSDSCNLNAYGKYKKISAALRQQGGQCYGFAVASTMLHDERYDFESKRVPSDYDSNANYAAELSKESVERLIVLMSMNQFTPHIREHLRTCKTKDILSHFNDLRTRMQNQESIALIAIYRINGGGGHVLTPYKIAQEGDIAKIYVYDSNYPLQNGLYIEVNLKEGSWRYDAGRVMATDSESTLYRGEGYANPFCSVALSQTQSLKIEDDTHSDMVSIDLYGQASQVRVAIFDTQERIVGYDFRTNSYAMDIPGATEEPRLDSMPSLYKIPVSPHLSDIETIESTEEFMSYISELLFVAVGSTPQKEPINERVALSMQSRGDGFRSSLMFRDIIMNENTQERNSTLALAFHPKGRFMMFDKERKEDPMPTIELYYDDDVKQEGAVHTITLRSMQENIRIGFMIEALDRISVFAMEREGDEFYELERFVDYEIRSVLNSSNRSTTSRFRQKVGSAYRLNLEQKRARSSDVMQRLF